MKRIYLVFFVLITFTISGFAGIEWTNKVITVAKKKRNRNELSLKVAAQNGIVRVDYLDVKRKKDFVKAGTTWIYNSKDDKIYVIDHKEKSVTPMTLDYMLNMSQMVGKVIKIKVEDYTAETKNLGSEKINGYSCKHIKLITDYTMKIKIVFIKKKYFIHEEKEIWGSNKVKGISNLSEMYLNKNIKTGFKDFDALIKKQMKQNKNLGFPLKTVVREIYKNKKGKIKQDTTTTTTVENLVSKTFPKSYFEIPKGYTINKALFGPK